jgi:hypothetical protein
MCKDPQVELSISYGIGNEANRNGITKYFLAGNYDYLLMVDSDQEPLTNPLDMIQHDKDVVSMPTILNIGFPGTNLVWSVFDKEGGDGYVVSARKERGDGLEKVYAVSTGCILIKRKVLETLNPPFVPVRDGCDNRLVGQDIAFSMRCQEKGFEIWVDWDNPTKHFKETDLLSI